jgi:hypothetical protein
MLVSYLLFASAKRILKKVTGWEETNKKNNENIESQLYNLKK